MVTFLTIYVVPRMSELFAGFGNELPTVTQIVVGISRWLSVNVFWFGPLIIGGAVLLSIWSRTPSGKLQISALILKIPLAGSLSVQLSVAQATRSLATLLAGGIVARFGYGRAFMFNALSFLASAWAVSRLRLREGGFRAKRALTETDVVRPWHEYTEGLRYMRYGQP